MKMRNTRAATSSSTGCTEVPVLETLTEFDAVNRTFAQMLCDRAEREPDVVAYCSWSERGSPPDHMERISPAGAGGYARFA